MAQKNLFKFYSFVGKDENLQKRFSEILEKVKEESVSSEEVSIAINNVIELGKEYGFYFTKKEFLKSIKDASTLTSEDLDTLADEDLEKVAGGVNKKFAAITFSVLTVAGLGGVGIHNLINKENTPVYVANQVENKSNSDDANRNNDKENNDNESNEGLEEDKNNDINPDHDSDDFIINSRRKNNNVKLPNIKSNVVIRRSMPGSTPSNFNNILNSLKRDTEGRSPSNLEKGPSVQPSGPSHPGSGPSVSPFGSRNQGNRPNRPSSGPSTPGNGSNVTPDSTEKDLEIQRLREQLAQQQTENRNLQAENRRVRQELETTRNDVRTDIRGIDDLIERLRAENRQLQDRLQAEGAENADLRRQLNEANNAIGIFL